MFISLISHFHFDDLEIGILYGWRKGKKLRGFNEE